MLTDISKSLKDIQEYLYKITGIYLDTSKQTMIKNRLETLKKFPVFEGITTTGELIALASRNAQARQLFINAFTTNQTDFFREKAHFQDMLDRVLPSLFKNQFNIRIYCAASSTGEEPYSIAATVLHASEIYNSSCNVEILASDIDTSVLQEAEEGLFTLSPTLNLPNWVNMDKYFDTLQKCADGTRKIRAKDELKRMIKFFPLNLFDNNYPFRKDEFDVIFCRNVLIYFKVHDQNTILHRLFRHLKMNGTLYIGHAEDVLGLKEKLERLGNKTYIKIKE
ncbi:MULTISPECIES: CheR family methyltransferase [unclassified Helicobacter]|uniref:CheR family methyltransferase n=1 Tax=unclassified Helicobacter TaxID=2593540 RepID=UPI000ACE3EBD|nr:MULTISPECIES: protein-glutamate O-methyltransferase CheR [unclassified Helicobacter]